MKTTLLTLAAAALLWLVLSSAIFAFRHPWATDTERLIHIPDALVLRKIPHQQMRP